MVTKKSFTMKFAPKMQEPELRILEEKIIALIKREINTAPKLLEVLKLDKFYLYRVLKRLETEKVIFKKIHKKKGYVEHSTYHLPQL